MDKVDADAGCLPHLETYSKAAELCNFTEAAKALHLTQAAVSQRIQAIEKSVATALFRRQGGRVLLTESGRRLYEYAQRILELHREARRAVTGRREPVGGELLLAASSIPGEHLLPELLAAFRREHPHIRVRAAAGDSRDVTAQVERGLVSLGLVGDRNDNPALEFRRLADDRLAPIVPSDHPWAKRTKVTLAQLRAQPLILRESGSGQRHGFEKALEQAGLSPADFRVGLELGSNEAIREAVLRGMGVAVLSLHAVRHELAAGRLHALQVLRLNLDRAIYLVRDRRRVLPAPARTFLQFLETHPVGDAKPA